VSLNIEVCLTEENDSGFNKSSLTEKVHKIMTNSACNRFNRLLSKDFQYSLITLLKYDMSIKKKREEISLSILNKMVNTILLWIVTSLVIL
jgi:methionyl-tRNA synthetase